MADLNRIINESVDDFSDMEPLEQSSPGASHMLEHRSLKRLIDFLFLPSTHVMPSERVFAETLLLRDWEGLPLNAVERLALRLANAVEVAPRLALKLASCGRIEVSEPLLYAAALNDFDLVTIANKCSQNEQLIIAKRNNLSSIVSGILVEIGNEDVVKTLLMNPGAKISAKTLNVLVAKARNNISLQSALLVRPEMTGLVAMDLFWDVPGEMREYILLTYLCERRSLTGFLHEDSAWQNHQSTLCRSDISDERLKIIIKMIVNGESDNAIDKLAQDARLSRAIASRIFKDQGGEALLVVAKAMGASRAGANDILMRFINSKPHLISRSDRLEPLRGLFDRISRDQALVALQYWACKMDNPSCFET